MPASSRNDSVLARDQGGGAMPPTGWSPSLVACQKKSGSMWWWMSTVKVTAASLSPRRGERPGRRSSARPRRAGSERELPFAAGGVDPDDVGEISQAVRAGAAPAAVAHAAHRRVDLVVHRR